MKNYKEIKDFYEENFLLIDFVFSVIIVFTILTISKFEIYKYINLNNFNDTNKSIITFFGTILGFLITLMTIIYAFSINLVSGALKRLKRTGIFPKIYSVYLNTIFITGILVFFGFVVITIKLPESHLIFFYKTIFSLELVLISTFVFRIYRCIWILKELINLSEIKK